MGPDGKYLKSIFSWFWLNKSGLFYFLMKIYTSIYKLANFHANRRTWLFHGLSGTMCGSLHKISEKSYQYKDGTWDIPSRSVEKVISTGLFKVCGKKIALTFECSSNKCLKYRYILSKTPLSSLIFSNFFLK